MALRRMAIFLIFIFICTTSQAQWWSRTKKTEEIKTEPLVQQVPQETQEVSLFSGAAEKFASRGKNILNENVVEELKLSDSQQEKLQAIVDESSSKERAIGNKYDAAIRPTRQDYEDKIAPIREKRNQGLSVVRKDRSQDVYGILTKQQRAKLEEIAADPRQYLRRSKR